MCALDVEKGMNLKMKIVKKEEAEKCKYAATSKVLDYSFALNEKNLDFCINTITGRYPEEGYCSNLGCEELCYVLEGDGTIYKKDKSKMNFKKEDIIFINKKEIYYWEGNFTMAIICNPAWTKEQCQLYNE